MHHADLDRVDEIHASAFELDGARGSPFFRGRVEHTLRTDPDGAFVAVGSRGRVEGVSMATRRDGLWGLALLAVDPRAQERGAGRGLLDRALTYARPGDARMVLASLDPRAQHLYARAGLTPRPTVAARGSSLAGGSRSTGTCARAVRPTWNSAPRSTGRSAASGERPTSCS